MQLEQQHFLHKGALETYQPVLHVSPRGLLVCQACWRFKKVNLVQHCKHSVGCPSLTHLAAKLCFVSRPELLKLLSASSLLYLSWLQTKLITCASQKCDEPHISADPDTGCVGGVVFGTLAIRGWINHKKRCLSVLRNEEVLSYLDKVLNVFSVCQ